jgi:transposase
LKRRWTPAGHRPSGRLKIGYEYGYLYCALAPLTGDLFCLLLPSMEKVCFEKFVAEFEAYLTSQKPDDKAEATLLILDGAGCHQENVLAEKSQLRIEKLPPACPELNPVERFFEELRKELANQVFEDIRAVEAKLEEVLKKYWEKPAIIKQLTLFPYINTSNLN